MEQSEGFVVQGKENKVNKLDKLMYDLKQFLNNDMKV